MSKTLLTISFFLICLSTNAQLRSPITGKVVDQKGKASIAGAVIRQNKADNYSTTDAAGNFRLTLKAPSDTITISHVGYRTVVLALKDFQNETQIELDEYALELKAVTILSRSFNFKEIENGMRLIKENLYAHNIETTNALYNLFLSALEEAGETAILKRCSQDFSGYSQEHKNFLKMYSQPSRGKRAKKDSTQDFSNFPVINISHEGAVLFCEWLTLQYNSNPGKKKFKQIKFRLPTLNEWQIAALGYPKFQSWNLEENFIEVVIPSDTISPMLKGNKSPVKVSKENVWYPWYNAYNYRKKPYNHMNCYLGNFKIDGSKPVCNNVIRPGGDGWTKMSLTAAYYPNDMGFYDVVGNAAEMIDQEFIACGGSWNDLPSQSTIHSTKTYRKPNDTVGFRFFMEVIEK